MITFSLSILCSHIVIKLDPVAHNAHHHHHQCCHVTCVALPFLPLNTMLQLQWQAPSNLHMVHMCEHYMYRSK